MSFRNGRKTVRDCSGTLYRQSVYARWQMSRLRVRIELHVPRRLRRNRLPVRVRRLSGEHVQEWSDVHRQRAGLPVRLSARIYRRRL